MSPKHFDIQRFAVLRFLKLVQALFATFSPWIARGPERKEALLDELATVADEQFGGRVVRPYQTVVISARTPTA